MKLLSIISPFHNSLYKCERLLKTLEKIDDPAVELILVDDGSSDGTGDRLSVFQATARTRTLLVRQDNRGPGGARNHGLSLASGEYVWFVDSDDDINPEAIAELKRVADQKYDFIDFNLFARGEAINTMGLPPGEYSPSSCERRELINKLGRIPAKILRRSFVVNNNLFYPEFCLYEDNPYEFIYPFWICRFYKSGVMAYYYHEEHDSVTRGSLTPRYFDRMYTAIYGFVRVVEMASPEERVLLERKFINLYLFNTVARQIYKNPGSSWLTALRVMRQYRDVAKSLEISASPLKIFAGNYKARSLFYLLWGASFCLSSQEDYFEQLRLKAWGCQFSSPYTDDDKFLEVVSSGH